MRQLLLCGILFGLFQVLPSFADYKNSNKEFKRTLESGGSFTFVESFEAGDQASVVVVGAKGRPVMGLYIFDEHGNCLTRDDQGTGNNADDLAVEWVAPQTGHYGIEIRNLSPLPNGYELAVRYRREVKKEQKS